MLFSRFFLKKNKTYTMTNKKLYLVKVINLDRKIYEFTLNLEHTGKDCLKNVGQKLELEELEYFGLKYVNRQNKARWVELDKPLKKQLEKYGIDLCLYLTVMYYLPNLDALTSQSTRYYLYLQVKSSIVDEECPCTEAEAIELAGFLLQIEFGDHDPEVHTYDLLKQYEIFPEHLAGKDEAYEKQLIEKAVDLHKSYRGMKPGEVEIKYIEKAMTLHQFSVHDLTPAKNSFGHDVRIGTSYQGLVVLARDSNDCRLWRSIVNVTSNKQQISFDFSESNCLQFSLEDSETAKLMCKMCNAKRKFFLSFGDHSSNEGASMEALVPSSSSSSSSSSAAPAAATNPAANDVASSASQQRKPAPIQRRPTFRKSREAEDADENRRLSCVEMSASDVTTDHRTSLQQQYYSSQNSLDRLQQASIQQQNDADIGSTSSFTVANHLLYNSHNNHQQQPHHYPPPSHQHGKATGGMASGSLYSTPSSRSLTQSHMDQDSRTTSCLSVNSGRGGADQPLPPYRPSPNYNSVLRKDRRLSQNGILNTSSPSSSSLVCPPSISSGGHALPQMRPRPHSMIYSQREITQQSTQVMEMTGGVQVIGGRVELANRRSLQSDGGGGPSDPTSSAAIFMQHGGHLPNSGRGDGPSSPDGMYGGGGGPLRKGGVIGGASSGDSMLSGSTPALVPLAGPQLTKTSSSVAAPHFSRPPVPCASTPDLNYRKQPTSYPKLQPTNHQQHLQQQEPAVNNSSMNMRPHQPPPPMMQSPTVNQYALDANMQELVLASKSNGDAKDAVFDDNLVDDDDDNSETAPRTVSTIHLTDPANENINLYLESVNAYKQNYGGPPLPPFVYPPQPCEDETSESTASVPTVQETDASGNSHHLHDIELTAQQHHYINDVRPEATMQQLQRHEKQHSMQVPYEENPHQHEVSPMQGFNGTRVNTIRRNNSNNNPYNNQHPHAVPQTTVASNPDDTEQNRQQHSSSNNDENCEAPLMKGTIDERAKQLEDRMKAKPSFMREYDLIAEAYGEFVESAGDRDRFPIFRPFIDTGLSIEPTPDNPRGYINASRIEMAVCGKDFRYIASQSPQKGYEEDFWQMIWRENVSIIVIIGNEQRSGKNNIDRYWPTGEYNDIPYLVYGEYKVMSLSARPDSLPTCSTLNLSLEKRNEKREIWMFQFKAWPKTGVPASPDEFIAFMDIFQSIRRQPLETMRSNKNVSEREHNSPPTPVVVQCPNGSGRTGVFIFCEMLMFALEHTQTSFLQQSNNSMITDMLRELRHQRAFFVNGFSQYKFVYQCLVCFLKKSRLI